MAIDFSSISSMYSLLGTTYGTTTQTKPAANFEDYLMDALNPANKKDKTSKNSFYDFMANTANTSLLNGLMNANNGLGAIGGYDVYAALIGNSNDTSINPFGMATSLNKDAFSNYLQSGLQSTILKNMNTAKAKLQASYEDYVAKIGDTPDEAAKLRKAQMEQNLEMVSKFIDDKVASTSASNTQNVNASNLLNQLGGSSTLLDWLTKSSSTSNTNPQHLLNQLSASGNYYQQRLNS